MPHLSLRRDSTLLGSFSPKQVKTLIRRGKVVGTDLLCVEGDDNWIAVAEVPALASELHAEPPPNDTPPRRRKRTSTKQTKWDQLAALETNAVAAPPVIPTSKLARADKETKQPTALWRSDVADGVAGTDWDPARFSMNSMFVVGMARACIISAAAGAVIMKHLAQLAGLGLGVFIPTAAGNQHQFKGNELFHIGFAMIVVVSTLGIILWLAFTNAREVFFAAACGLFASLFLTGMMSSGDAATDTLILKMFSIGGIVSAVALAGTGVPLMWSPMPIAAKVVLSVSILAGIISCGVAFQGLSTAINVEFALPRPEMHFPYIPSLAVGYMLLLALEIGFSAWVLWFIAKRFGDHQEKETIDFFLWAHVLLVGLILGIVYLINRDVATMFTGVVFGCVAAAIVATDVIWHTAAVLYTRNTLK